MLQRLINQAVKLPALLSRFDKIEHFLDSSNFAVTNQLQDDFRNFIESLWRWESNTRSETSLPLYWSKPTYTDSLPRVGDVLWYPNIMTANSLTYCWAFEIVARRKLAILERRTTETQGCDPRCFDTCALLQTAVDAKVQRSAAVLAKMICDSMSYLLQPEFKLYGPGSAFFTLPTAMRVFQDESGRYDTQLARCQGIIDHLASIGVFFPRT